MSLHLRIKNTQCSDCALEYIPYKNDLPCPKCGKINTPTTEQLELVGGCCSSLIVNMNHGGRYIPMAWAISDYCDWLQDVIFQLYELLDTEIPNQTRGEQIKNVLSNSKFDEPTRKYLHDLIIEIDGAMPKNTWRFRSFNKFVIWVRQFLP